MPVAKSRQPSRTPKVDLPFEFELDLGEISIEGFDFSAPAGGGESDKAAVDAQQHWEAWIRANFPTVASAPFALRHRTLWDWFESLQVGLTPAPRVEVWPRGGAKSATAELGVAYVGARLARRFCLYVCETQDQADKHVQAISGLLERLGYGPAMNKQGHSKGWRREQLRASNGFNLAGIGLDVAARGVKLDEFRPDIIVFDDVDNREDSPKKTGKKESAITQSLLPAGSSDCVVLFLQNLIIDDGIVARIVSKRADYLLDADVVGPIPAIEGLQVADAQLPNGRTYKKIVAGIATWAGQSLAIAQRQIIQWGWTAFKREAQHEVVGADGFFFDDKKFVYVDEIPEGIKLRIVRCWDLAATQGGGDYTVGVLLGIDESNGVVYILDAVRHQFEPNGVRDLLVRTARRDAECCVYGPDELDDRGYYRKSGEKLFSFADNIKGRVETHLPEDPAQAGKFQVVALKEALTGFDVSSSPVTTKKATRAENWAEKLNGGNARLIRAEWNWSYSEEHRKFRADEDHDYDDQVDPTADGVNLIAEPVPEWDFAAWNS